MYKQISVTHREEIFCQQRQHSVQIHLMKLQSRTKFTEARKELLYVRKRLLANFKRNEMLQSAMAQARLALFKLSLRPCHHQHLLPQLQELDLQDKGRDHPVRQAVRVVEFVCTITEHARG